MPMLPPTSVTGRKRESRDESVEEPEEKKVATTMAQKITRQIIHSANAPAAIGPYSQAVRAGNTIYLSGSLGLDAKTGELKEGVVEQTHQSLRNIGEVLKAAGAGFNNVVKTTVLLADIKDFAAVNDVYKQYFTEKFPARAAYQVLLYMATKMTGLLVKVAALPKGGLVEIEAVAVAGDLHDV